MRDLLNVVRQTGQMPITTASFVVNLDSKQLAKGVITAKGNNGDRTGSRKKRKRARQTGGS